ncbi:prolyl oligopeptidase family serine peptidase [Neolewinella aurantiaca]|uniref:Prolyl oligopeptidase family serine peptidase n=1 Tax=Neolewinella aurantiaca TaxID=2602767 RepID=A0A5C7FFJ6_9BACT|nr:dienelactone hydrolase family protein [Neolewinella aurantiaca]TXF84705.1 prolyl oligopeptidase family serine peptidase [Neolewinella aurantiaca]
MSLSHHPNIGGGKEDVQPSLHLRERQKKIMKPFVFLLILSFPNLLSGQFSANFLDLGRDSIHFLVNYPEGYEEGKKDWPLVLFLHGGGESGNDLEKVKVHGPTKHIAAGKQFPFVTLAPQNKYVRGFWDIAALGHLLDDFVAKHRIDEDRIYLTGLSRGGLGAWMLAMQNPGRFAALVPVCGAVPASYDIWIPEDLPVWIHHGAEDVLIHPSESIRMAENLRAKGMKPKLTIYEGIGHNAWDPAYADPELYKWLLEQVRSQESETKN